MSIAERNIARQLGGERAEVGRLVGRLHPARLDAREIEQRVGELQETQCRCDERGRAAGVERLESGIRHGEFELEILRSGPSIKVSGVRNSWLTLEKNAVLARSISASASARLPFLLICARFADRSGDLARKQRVEVAIGFIKGEVRAYSRHHQRGQLIALVRGIGSTTALCGGSGQGPGGTTLNRRAISDTVTVS